jgi:hypothetical protein
LLAKPKLWLRMLGSFSFHVMKWQLVINSFGFPFMHM